MKQRLPLARTDLVWCCPERPVNHYVLPFSHVILDLVLVRYEREAEVHYLYLSMRYIHDPQLINGSRSKFLLVVHDIYFL